MFPQAQPWKGVTLPAQGDAESRASLWAHLEGGYIDLNPKCC